VEQSTSEVRRDNRSLLSMLALFAAGLGFYLVGLVLGLARPEDRLTQRASLMLLVFAGYQLYQSLNLVMAFFTSWELLGYAAVYLGFPVQFALAYSFYYRFPRSAPRGRFWTALEYVLYLSGGGMCLFYAYWCLNSIPDGPLALSSRGSLGSLNSTPFILTSVVAMIAVIARNYRRVKEPDQRRRIKWVIYGSIAGIVPIVGYATRPRTTPGTLQHSEMINDRERTGAVYNAAYIWELASQNPILISHDQISVYRLTR
jgi:eukaryotic-like serine/threonine-protein kinase